VRKEHVLIDGGILNNLPVDVMVASEPGPVIAVDVMRRIEAADLESSGRSAIPTIVETLARATVLGSIERAEGNRQLATLMVTPDVHGLGLRDFRRIDEALDAGRRAAEAALADGGKEQLAAAAPAPVQALTTA
jgi:NTE family protein